MPNTGFMGYEHKQMPDGQVVSKYKQSSFLLWLVVFFVVALGAIAVMSFDHSSGDTGCDISATFSC